ncbi:unnamed protein product [Periconia digitata]|uniref:Uncharacterized protein n=1 Tax=Periconia digitata TaxID=1303443 RepID=A0A9W4UG83_9PLEO|nr:unnamed protein product [Periconia digitata]
MLAVPKTSLASIICPVAPFLVPRLLRSPAPRALLTQFSTRSTYATDAKSNSKRTRQPGVKSATRGPKIIKYDASGRSATLPETAPMLVRMQHACTTRNIQAVMDLYPTLLESRSLHVTSKLRIAEAIHTVVRNLPPSSPALKGIFPFLQRMVEDIKSGKLPPDAYAHVHLLGAFKSFQKYEEGFAFWQWLAKQDDTYVSQAVYGAAIELMAYGNIGALSDLEGIYMDGLKRFPGTFAEYHLSPNAIVPNRDQNVAMVDLPIMLLQGICTARIVHGEWKNAYLAFDTALRLKPTQVPIRFFELFMTERPVQEAYTAYLVACRIGIVFKPSHLTGLTKKIRDAMASSSSLNTRMVLLRAIANSLYAYQQSGGTLEGVHIGAFISACETLLPERGPGEVLTGIQAEYRDAIVHMAHDLTSQLLQAGMPPHPRFFTSLIGLAGSQGADKLLHATLKDIRSAKLDLDQVGRRIVMKSAGLLGDFTLLVQYWNRIVTLAENEHQRIADIDWVTFVRACKHLDQVQYCKEQLSHLEITLTTSLTVRLHTILDAPPRQPRPVKLTGLENFASQMKELKAQFSKIVTVVMSGQPLNPRRNPFYMAIDPTQKSLGTIEDMRTIYDEFTIDPHQPPSTSEQNVLATPTGLSLGSLRYLNWVSVVEMMHQASLLEQKQQGPDSFPLNVSFDLCHRNAQNANDRNLPLPLDALRSYIKTLRAPSPIDYHHDTLAHQNFDAQNNATESIPPQFLEANMSLNDGPTTTIPRRSRTPIKKPKHPLGLQEEHAGES